MYCVPQIANKQIKQSEKERKRDRERNRKNTIQDIS